MRLFSHVFAAAALLLAPAAYAQDNALATASPAKTAIQPWLYEGSDVPVDTSWTFGELPNGVRYAVKKNDVPAGQVSIRVRIDAGALHEKDDEQGFAHLIEHLSFRGSTFVPDGEAKRIWQRFGVSFGSDSNAQTTPTQTVYKLDLPNATPEKLDESIKIISGMMRNPRISDASLNAERAIVLAELREGSGAKLVYSDALRAHMFQGQRLASRSTIGTPETLQAADAARLNAFHDRWYRPERAIVVIAGDAEPATFEALITKYFAGWKGVGPAPGEPDFGKPSAAAPRAKLVVEAGLPTIVSLAVLRPWVLKDDTVEYNRGKLIESLALRLISRRLEERARAGGSFLSAGVDQEDVARSVDGTFLQIVPLGDDWQAAVRDVRAVIADALVNPPSQADIDRESGEFLAALQVGVEQARTQGGGELTDNIVEAVNIRETVASPQVALDVFSNMKGRLTPSAMLAATKRMFAGTPMRAVLTSPKPVDGGETLLLAALAAEAKPLSAAARTPVSFDRVPKLGAPGTVVQRAAVGDMGLEFVDFANGARAMIFANNAEAGKIYVTVRFGRGNQALPTDRPTDVWAAGSALVAGGIGDLTQDELDRLTSGRRINLGFATGDDAFILSGTTRAADLADQLRLMAAKLVAPGWDPNPVVRARAAMSAGYAASDASPSGVLSRVLPGLLHGGDPRWTFPTLAQVQAMTPQSFRALWEPLLRTGPIEVSVFGDVDKDTAVAAIAATLGAIPARAPAPVLPAAATSKAAMPTPTPLVRTHRGPPDQAAAVLAWPTAGGQTEIYESRKLDILAQIFNDRMFDQLREGEGASYSPSVSSNWPAFMPGGGSVVVSSQLKPGGIGRFFTIARAIAADLVAKPVTADEIARSVGPMRQTIARASSGNSFWLGQLQGATTEPRRLQALATLSTDYAKITPAEVQAAAKRWLVPEKSFALVVMPEAK